MADPLAPGSYQPPFPAPLSIFAGAYYSDGGESLLLSVNNAATGVTLKLAGRTIAFGESRVSPFEMNLVPATDRSTSTVRVILPAGWLLSAVVTVTAGTPLVGQCFTRLSIVHGVSTVGPELWTVAADYVTAKQPVTWPGRPIQSSLDGGGALRSIAGTTPGAGAEVSEAVPTGARWEPISFHARLVTAVAVANRFPRLVLDDGGAIPYGEYHPPPTAQVASTTAAYSWGEGVPAQVGQVNYQAPLPVGLRAGAAHRLRTITTGIQAADQWDQVQYLVRETIEGA